MNEQCRQAVVLVCTFGFAALVVALYIVKTHIGDSVDRGHRFGYCDLCLNDGCDEGRGTWKACKGKRNDSF